MPCLFIRNVPPFETWDPAQSEILYQRIADAVGLTISDIEIHIENTQYYILQPNGTINPAKDVHIFVEWHGRPFAVKEKVAIAINNFFTAHGLETDITFRDSPKGTFFVKGKLVGKPPSDVEEL